MNLHAPNIIAASSTQHVLHRDYESRGVLKLEDVGAWKYAADPRTEILCCAYAVDNDPVKLWLPPDLPPTEFFEAAAPQNTNWEVAAHNAQFDIALEHFKLCRLHGFPKFPLSRQRCTMAMALACSLPPKLELAADALELIHRKDKAGQRLMLMLAKPRRPRKDEDPQALLWFDDEERRQRLYDYAKKDLEAEREFYQSVRPLSAEELELWQLDVRINARGFHVDRELAEAARAIAQSAAPELEAELTYITNGAVTSINQVARLKAWLAEHNCPVDTLDKTAIEELLRSSDLAAPVRRALELRQGGAQAAAKKITALLTHCGPDDRIRGAFRYHGASTGRWTGNGLQPQNLKHSTTEDLNAAIAAISTGNYAHVRNLYPQPLKVIGDLSRSLICAAPDQRFIGADLSSIESRVLAWVADEEWKLNSYRRYDATHDPRDEPYCITACKIFRVPDGTYTDKSPERKVGKTCDLAFGYQGGLNAWRKFEPDRFTDEEVERFKQEWRAAHPNIRKFWYAIDRASWEAVRNREQVIRCGRLLLKCTGAYLFIKLPSGRKLAYPYPRIEIEDLQHEVVVFKDASAGQWRDCRGGNGAYGGLWSENVVSGISRDLLASAMLRLGRAGYRIVLHVHDEAVAEVAEDFGSTDEFTRLMIASPAWALGLPIAAKAWTGQRFSRS
jgi:DNA polymerase bacteriophage-type